MRVSGNWIAVIISVVLALVLEFIRFPDLIANARPEWLTLVLVHWILRRPDIAGVGFGFVIGLALDVVSGSNFGIHTLALSLVSYLLVGMQKKSAALPNSSAGFCGVFFW
jgi:rod shape-determining protein MreD